MAYSVGWIEKNMGISRKTLLIYEEKKLLNPVKNSNNKYREYSDDDLERIWGIKMLRELGYTIPEIIDIANSQDFAFRDSIGEKIILLEKEKYRLEQLIGHAKAIKATGRIPMAPKKMGSIKFEQFLQYSYETWNINSNPQMKIWQQVMEKSLNRPDEMWTEEELDQLDVLTGSFEIESILMLNAQYNELAKRKDLDVFHPEVQTIVKVIYDYYCEHFFSEVSDKFTPQKFADHIGNSFTDGDVSLINEKNYGKDSCDYIAKALEYFGEHSTYTD